MKDKYNEKLVEAFQKMSDEQKAVLLKPQSDYSYEEIQKRLESMFCPSTPAPEKAVIEGWVARDSQKASNSLQFHRNEVKRGKFYWENKEKNRPIGESLILPENLFPSITWESEPQRVKIEITLIDEKGE